jgi:mannose-6-phosphate isomerase-like protein (cupin superfamily)
MADYSVTRVADVRDMAADVGMDPDHFEIRFLREPLALQNFAVTLERFDRGWKPTRGHRHTVQEEVYFLVSGRAQAKLDGEVIELEPWTAVRVPPQTARAFRAADDEDAIFVAIAAPQAGFDDVEFIQDFWTD